MFDPYPIVLFCHQHFYDHIIIVEVGQMLQKKLQFDGCSSLTYIHAHAENGGMLQLHWKLNFIFSSSLIFPVKYRNPESECVSVCACVSIMG